MLLVALAAKFGIRSTWRGTVEVAAIAACTVTLAGYLAATIGLLNLSIDPIPFVLGTFWQVLGVCIFAIAAEGKIVGKTVFSNLGDLDGFTIDGKTLMTEHSSRAAVAGLSIAAALHHTALPARGPPFAVPLIRRSNR